MAERFLPLSSNSLSRLRRRGPFAAESERQKLNLHRWAGCGRSRRILLEFQLDLACLRGCSLTSKAA